MPFTRTFISKAPHEDDNTSLAQRAPNTSPPIYPITACCLLECIVIVTPATIIVTTKSEMLRIIF